MFVKVCGITRLEDARLAVRLGADAIGFVLWKGSRRAIEPDRARAIIQALPRRVRAVGVFVNEEVSTLEQLATRAGLHGVQLHGDEPPQYCEQVTRPVIRAVRLGARAEMPAVASVPASCTLLLDAYHPTERGGTGQRADWDRAAKIAATRRTILAGGLHAGNIAEAVRRVAPWGIDVSSGVESAPGVKDAALMRAFFAALRERVEESSHDGRV